MKGAWIVYTAESGYDPKPRVFDDRAPAQACAKTLAEASQGVTFFVAQIKTSAVSPLIPTAQVTYYD